MNLVKAQALANDLPIQELKKYADGFDPRIIPPWVATGTLQAKMDLNKRMQNMMGGAQGEQPSIKEQIEQKAGLMAANTMQQQQQQQQQQMAMAQRPGPAPAGIPQPEPQPEAPFIAARGGLASVPVRFAFKPGGIVGYSGENGSQVKREGPRVIKVPPETPGWEIELIQRENPDAIVQTGEEGSAWAKIGAAIMRNDDVEAMKQREAALAAPPVPQAQRLPVSEAQATMKAGPQAAVPPAPRQERQVPRPDAPRPAPTAQTGLPAAASRSPYFAQADAALNAPNVQPTPQSIIDEQRALSPEAMKEEMMKQRYEERKARADQERAAFEKTRPSGLDDLIRVFGQAAQYKGMSGLAPAYTANQQQKRAVELALEKRMNELYTAADTQEYEGAKEIYGARAKSMDAANRSYQERLKSRGETLAQLANVDEKRIQSVLDRLNNMEIAKLRAADAGSGDMKYLAQYLKLKADGNEQGAATLLESFNKFKRGEPKEDELTKKIAARRVDIVSSLMDPKTKQAQLAALDVLEKGASSGGNAGKVASRADVAATAKSSGKTEQQVMQDLKARGYTIQ